MSTEKQTTIIEVNGVKLEVDLRSAKRIDQLTIGSRVKCLLKTYDSFKTVPGVVVGFEPFEKRPTIVVAYLETDYSTAALKFQSFNCDTKDFEIIADLDNNALEIDKAGIIAKMDREYTKKEAELQELADRKAFFLAHFGRYFQEAQPA
jgi:hypothetical protein